MTIAVLKVLNGLSALGLLITPAVVVRMLSCVEYYSARCQIQGSHEVTLAGYTCFLIF